MLRKRAATPIPELAPSVEEYCKNRSTRERALVHENTLKAQLMAVLERIGLPDGDEGQHQMLPLEAPIEFVTYKGTKGVSKTVIGIQRQFRKGSMTLNEERTMAFLEARKMLDECTTTQVVINEDAILAAVFEKRISDKDVEALYDTAQPTYAFQLITEE
jgi:hypothetical protein